MSYKEILEIGQIGGESNNQISPPRASPVQQETQKSFFSLTLFPENDLEIERLTNLMKSISKKGIIGNEICPTTGKKHLQCFLNLKRRKRTTEMWKLFPGSRCRPSYAGEDANFKYCSKDGNFIQWDYTKTTKPFKELLNERYPTLTQAYQACKALRIENIDTLYEIANNPISTEINREEPTGKIIFEKYKLPIKSINETIEGCRLIFIDLLLDEIEKRKLERELNKLSLLERK